MRQSLVWNRADLVTSVLITNVFPAAFLQFLSKPSFCPPVIVPVIAPGLLWLGLGLFSPLAAPAKTSMMVLNASGGHRQVWVPSDVLSCRTPIDGGLVRQDPEVHSGHCVTTSVKDSSVPMVRPNQGKSWD